MTVAVERIAEALEAAPGWVRVGITAPDQRLRHNAVTSLAEFLSERIEQPLPVRDPRQMALPL